MEDQNDLARPAARALRTVTGGKAELATQPLCAQGGEEQSLSKPTDID
jgi:hypothetical protein